MNYFQKCYEILKVSAESDQETVRAAYIEIVKIVHPDSGHPEASAEKFAEVDNAFRILQAKYAKDRHGIKETSDVNEHDINVCTSIISHEEETKNYSMKFCRYFTAHCATTSTIFELRWCWYGFAGTAREAVSAIESIKSIWQSM